MSDLQLSLLGLGAFAILVVFFYNAWQERKFRRAAEQHLRPPEKDVLMHDGSPPELTDRVEPGYFPPAASPVFPEASPQTSTQASTEVSSPVIAASPGILPPDRDLFHSQLDYVATIHSSEPVKGMYLVQAGRTTLAKVGKPVRWAGFNPESGHWERITEGSDKSYAEIHAGLQMLDRSGVITEPEMGHFEASLQKLASEFLGSASFAPRKPALEGAVLLDQFCGDVDIQISIHIIKADATPISGAALYAAAEVAGMQLSAEGRFCALGEDTALLFTLVNRDGSPLAPDAIETLTTMGVTLLLDVPVVVDPVAAFDALVVAATHISRDLAGQLVDDAGHPLAPAVLYQYRAQLSGFAAMMEERGIPAGSPLALRLFA